MVTTLLRFLWLIECFTFSLFLYSFRFFVLPVYIISDSDLWAYCLWLFVTIAGLLVNWASYYHKTSWRFCLFFLFMISLALYYFFLLFLSLVFCGNVQITLKNYFVFSCSSLSCVCLSLWLVFTCQWMIVSCSVINVTERIEKSESQRCCFLLICQFCFVYSRSKTKWEAERNLK